MTIPRYRSLIIWAAGALMLAAPTVRADSYLASGVNPVTGQAIAARVDFANVGGKLQVTLTNTASADVLAPTDVLTAVFFNVPTAVVLTPLSAKLGAGAVVYFDPVNGTNAGGTGNVGGEWDYATGISVPGDNSGISSTGLGLFGAGDFGGSNLQGPVSVDGLQYGITSAGDIMTTGNAAVTGNFALIKNAVVFTLAFSSNQYSLDNLSLMAHVTFQYGTALNEMGGSIQITPVPAPGAALLGMIGLGLVGRAKMRFA